jgi:mRNA turnover protein 4
MPKSRRDRQITLSKTRKRPGLETKQALVDKIRKAVDETSRVIVFSVDNERNNLLKAIREEWKAKDNTSFFMGKNRVMALALGKSEVGINQIAI